MAETNARRARAEARARRRGDDGGSAEDGAPHVGDAARAAASAAIAAAAVGAAQALARHRHSGGDEEDVPEETDEREEPQQREPEQHEPVQQETRRPEPPRGNADELVERARAELRALRGADAEKVSSIARTADGWRIGLEVVEVHRIPESTDVLAVYEVELDGDGSLIGFERTDRYYRSEVEHR